MEQALPDSRRRARYLAGGVLAALLALCAVLMRRPESTSAPTAATAIAEGKPAGRATDLDQRRAIARLGPIQRSGVNGADLYANAIALYSRLSDADKDALKRWSMRPDFKTGADLFSRIQPILALLQRARKADYVDWGIDPRSVLDEPAGYSGHLTAVRSLGDVALWGAAYQFQADPESAVGDLAAAETLSRSSSTNFIGFLIGDGIDSGAFRLLAQNAPLLVAGAMPDMGDVLDANGEEQRLENATDGEIAALQELIDQYTNPATRNGSFVANAAASVSADFGTVISQLQWNMKIEQGFVPAASDYDDGHFQQWLAQMQADPPPIPASSSSDTLAGIRHGMEQVMVQMVMVEAGLALEQGDQAQFQAITDPATGAPFKYTQTDNGFELTSGLPSKVGRQVRLDFPWVAPEN